VPTITAIKSQRSKKRVNVYLDGKFGFGIDLENFIKLGLKVEQDLTEKEIEKIIGRVEFQKTLDKLLRFATLRPRSEKEVDYWLKRKKVYISLHKKLFNRLKRLELVGDEKFARWWVEQRNSFRPRSKRILTQELKLKGIDRNIIEDVLFETKIDEAKIAKDLLRKRMYKWERLNRQDAKKKKSEYLARKGFGWDVIRSVVK